MPARTLSPAIPVDQARYPYSFRNHNQPTHDHTHRDLQNIESGQSLDVLYDMNVPPPLMHAHHNHFQPVDHIYPHPSIPLVPMHPYALPTLSQVVTGASSLAYPGSSGGPNTHGGAYTAMPNPAVWHPPPLVRTVHPIALPPPLPHKVWILDCKSCGTFLTNRGMRAVLLLRPTVALYSTDALPINCSAYSSSLEAVSASNIQLPPPPSSVQANGSNDPDRPRVNARACECLTQTLCCHSCGSSVGYMIVSPCQRCTSSISVTNRTTNGHRFVFYSSETVATERHYIAGERGVRQFSLLNPPANSGLPPSPRINPVFASHIMTTHRSVPPPLGYVHTPSTEQGSSMFVSESSRNFSGRTSSRSFESLRSDSSSPPPLSPVSSGSGRGSGASSPSNGARFIQPLVIPPPPPPSHTTSPRVTDIPRFAPPPEYRGQPEHCPDTLKSGDVLYWHHLLRSGEIPGVVEDPRARVPGMQAQPEKRLTPGSKPSTTSGKASIVGSANLQRFAGR